MSLMMHTMSNYRGSIEVPRVPWLDGPRGYDTLTWEELGRPISSLRLRLDMVPPSKVSLHLSQSGCALVRARDAGVLWYATSATSATPTDNYSNHNSLYQGYPRSLLLVILVPYYEPIARPWSPSG